MFRKSLLAVLIVIVAGVIIAIVLHFKSLPVPAPVVKPIVATQPTSQPTTRKVKPKYPTYMEVVRKHNPAVAATQPLDSALELPDAAHLIIHDPVYLDPTGNLWITSADGAPTEKALETAGDSEDHIIKDQPVFAHWVQDDRGAWSAMVVVKADGGGYDIITKKNRSHFADDRAFKWDTAFSILGKIVVATDAGMDVFDVDPKVVEHYHPLPGVTAASNPPATLLDTRGVLAWSPWENGKTGSNGVSRFVDGDWHDLSAADWPAKPVQLSMLLDGTVLRVAASNDPAAPFPDQMQMSIGELEAAQFNDAHINELITQLSDPDSDQRQAAFDELSRYGPALSIKLEKIINDQVPEAKMRMRQLMGTKLAPTLAGMTPVDNRLQVVRRCPDGTVILFAPSGVQIPTEHDEPDLVYPAWLAMHNDGRIDHPLTAALTRDQKPEACTLRCIHDEWIVSDEAGPRRLVGSLFEPLLLPSEKRFTDLVGIATKHRWVFHDPTGDTLLIDPQIADPTPRLPAWVITVDKGTAGWDATNFPAVTRGDQASNWELEETGWKPLTPPEKVTTEPEAHATPTTGPTGSPILTAADGTQYFDGKTMLGVVKPTGQRMTWMLPPEAVGTAEPTLIQTSDGLLFLYNQAGRLLRIKPTPGEAEPFKLEATFTKDIPNADHPTRIWLDPVGRIDFVTDENVLTVTFPSGHIPKEIARMMLAPAH